MLKQSIITISVGKGYYHELTKNLIRSFLIHNKSNIKLNVLTDEPASFQKFQENTNVVIKHLNIGLDDKSFTSKFYMYDEAIAEENLFIDCDCLIYKDLSYVFDIFKEKSFCAVGTMQKEGDFFCDIQSIISHFKLKSLPVFVGSLYYFKKDKVAASVFQKAIELKKDYDKLGFIRLRNKENEEPLIATAMSLHAQNCMKAINIKADAMFYKTIKSNVIRGTNKLILLDSNLKSETIYSNNSIINIAIIHFNASFSDSWNYKLEIFRLNNYTKLGILTDMMGIVFYKLPYLFENNLKTIFRPIFRSVIGTREIKQSNRMSN